MAVAALRALAAFFLAAACPVSAMETSNMCTHDADFSPAVFVDSSKSTCGQLSPYLLSKTTKTRWNNVIACDEIASTDVKTLDGKPGPDGKTSYSMQVWINEFGPRCCGKLANVRCQTDPSDHAVVIGSFVAVAVMTIAVTCLWRMKRAHSSPTHSSHHKDPVLVQAARLQAADGRYVSNV
jgi:hypothetical protein